MNTVLKNKESSMNTKVLETKRLILRPFKTEDAEAMYNNWASDFKVSRYVTWDTHESLEVTKKIIEMWISEYANGSFNWLVELKENHEPIGSISVVHDKETSAEIGYCYGSKYWNNGYATEALRKVIEYLILEKDYYIVEAKHIGGNPASGRVMQKAGMRKDAILRKRMINKVTKERDDLVVYSIIKEEL